MSKIKVTITNRDNQKVVSEFSYEGSLGDLIDMADKRIKEHPLSFTNADFLMVEGLVCDGEQKGQKSFCQIENFKWWSPSQPDYSRYIKINVNGSTNKIKVPSHIVEGPTYIDEAMDYAREWVLRSYQNNFPKGTKIGFRVEIDLGNGRTEGCASMIEVGEQSSPADDKEMGE